MVRTTLFCLLLSASASAQYAPATPEEMYQAGDLLERSAQQRGHALMVGIGAFAASAIMYATGHDTGRVVGPIVMGAGLCVSVGITIGSIKNQAKAARLLRGR